MYIDSEELIEVDGGETIVYKYDMCVTVCMYVWLDSSFVTLHAVVVYSILFEFGTRWM